MPAAGTGPRAGASPVPGQGDHWASRQSPRGCRPSSCFAVFPFGQMGQRSGQRRASGGAGWGRAVPVLRGEGWNRPCLRLPAEPAAAPAQPTPHQVQGGRDPEDAGLRAHDPLPRVLGGGAALRAPQPTREREQQRDPCAPRAEAQGRTSPPRELGAGAAGRGRRAHATGVLPLRVSFRPSLTFRTCRMVPGSALPRSLLGPLGK